MKCKQNVTVTIIAICLITAAAHAQSRNLVLRFRVPFPFTVKNTTFAAGEYEVTQPGQFVLTLRNVENQASVFAHVLPAGSKRKRTGGREPSFTASEGHTSWRQYPMDRGRQPMTWIDQTKRRSWPIRFQPGDRKSSVSSPTVPL
jgi:hypothetical protein